MVIFRFLVCLLVLASLASCRSSSSAAQSESGDWVATWKSSVTDREGDTENITYRLWIHNAIGGVTVRLRFSNRYGKEALVIRNVSIARPMTASKLPPVDAASVTPITFAGRNEVSIPAGQELRSDAVAFALGADSDVAVTFAAIGGGLQSGAIFAQGTTLMFDPIAGTALKNLESFHELVFTCCRGSF